MQLVSTRRGLCMQLDCLESRLVAYELASVRHSHCKVVGWDISTDIMRAQHHARYILIRWSGSLPSQIQLRGKLALPCEYFTVLCICGTC